MIAQEPELGGEPEGALGVLGRTGGARPREAAGTRDNATRLSLRPLREETIAGRDVLKGWKKDFFENRDLVWGREERSES